MPLWQGKSKRKVTGGRRKFASKKRRYEIGSEKQVTVIEDRERKKSARTRGGSRKTRVLGTNVVNVTDIKKNKTVKTKILTVIENPANPFYVRRNIITKGAIIETELGKARVTSRPGQDGLINAVLITGK
jgi:small subunit ribosomal protein S8e